MPEALTLERMRADVARMLREDPADIGLDDNLMDWGLDSMRLLNLVLAWNEAGLQLDLSEIGAETSLSGWWKLVQQRQA
ncbi:phosphopantetheine-binding protein [Pseudorhodoferax sp. LjRoot39]|jgi:aryl carrier-like protein|uniref:phosphopantetheine-binding protein n=1 Tax=Pseudorhodoferax sp. LjRoot39 TaxID=3342328 RepID=UPI003ECEF16C